MPTVTVSRLISAPVDVVFRAVSDIERLPETNPDYLAVEFLSDQRAGAGTRFNVTMRAGKKEQVYEQEITEFDENRSVRMVNDSHGTVWDTLFAVAPEGDGTRLTLTMDARAHALVPRLLNPIMKGFFRKGMAKYVAAVAEYCESGAA